MIEEQFNHIINEKKINKEQYLDLSENQRQTFINQLLNDERWYSNMMHTLHHNDVLDRVAQELITQLDAQFFKEHKYVELFFSVIRNYYYNTPTEESKEKEVFDLIKHGFNHGMDINIDDIDYKTPLIHYVVGYGYLEPAKWLIEKGANVNVFNSSNEDILSTILDHCEEQEEEEMLKSFEYIFNLPQINRKLSHKYLTIALANEFHLILNVIKNSEVVEDSDFIKKALKYSPVESEEAQIWLEKNELNEKFKNNKNTGKIAKKI